MEKDKKQGNIFLFFVKMVIIFFLTDMFFQYGPSNLTSVIAYGKYGIYAVAEAIWALFVIFVMLLFHNSYVFTQKKMGFFKSILLGAPMVVFSCLIFLSSMGEINSSNFIDALSLAVYCLLIGICEEFMCRGWIQNEFIERFAKDSKQVTLSIFLSSLVFGFMHITNIWFGGQTVIETIGQIIQATAMGVLLGAIYFRSKNIWASVFVHGFWDFALFVGELNVIKDCTYGAPTAGVIASRLISSILLFVVYMSIALILLRKSKVNPILFNKLPVTEEDTKKDTVKFTILTVVAVISYILTIPVGLLLITSNEDGYETCYSYKKYNVHNVNTHYSSYDYFDIKNGKYSYSFKIKKDNLYVINNNTNEEMKLLDVDKFNLDRFIIFENKDIYNILVYGDIDGNDLVYYSYFIDKNNMSDDKEYLEYIDNSFEPYYIPRLSKVGYMTTRNSDHVYPYMVDRDGRNEFVIAEDNRIYLLTINDKKEESIINYVVEEEEETVPVENTTEETNACNPEVEECFIEMDEETKNIVDEYNSLDADFANANA